MDQEKKRKRKLSAENGNIRWIKDHYLRTKDGKDDYVFISYKSDDFEKVLDDIVYRTCKKYGLRVYFDTAFDDGSDLWITQYYKNMCTLKCKALIAFIDDEYFSSYACLLEIMTGKIAQAGGLWKEDALFFLPINIGSITELLDEDNTGLGTRRYSDGKINRHAGKELERFNEVCSEILDNKSYSELRKIYNPEKNKELYNEKTEKYPESGEMHLNITQCRKLMEKLIPFCNDNDGGNKDFVEVIHDKLINAGIKSVFEEPENNVTSISDERKEIESNPINSNAESIVIKSDFGGYSYTIFGKEYKAESREQGKLMYDAFSALVERHPELAERLTLRTSVSRIENVSAANTKEAKPSYFRTCKKFTVNGNEYYVGTSYGFDAKIAEIKGMFKLCGEDISEFVLNGRPVTDNKKTKDI